MNVSVRRRRVRRESGGKGKEQGKVKERLHKKEGHSENLREGNRGDEKKKVRWRVIGRDGNVRR